MVRSEAKTVQQYLETLSPDRREAIAAVREVILANLPAGYVESMNWGMISYEIPLTRYPKTYNKQPLVVAGLASQKNYMSLYLMSVYADKATEGWFHERYRASGKRLDMGKSCVHFRKLDNLPLDLVGEVIRRCSVEQYIERYEMSRRGRSA